MKDRDVIQGYLGGGVPSVVADEVLPRLTNLCSVVVGLEQPLHGDLNGRAFSRWSDAVEQRFAQALESRQVESFVLQNADAGEPTYVSLQGFTDGGLTTAIGEATYELVFVAPLETAAGGWQSALLTATIELAEAVEALQGQLHPTKIGEVGLAAYPALELDMIGAVDDIHVMRFGARALTRFLRTSAWLVYLTDGHVRSLGGFEAIERYAPASVRRASSGVALLVSDDPMVQDLDARCDRLHDYLAPLVVGPEDAVRADLGTTEDVDPVPRGDGVPPSMPLELDGRGDEGPDGTIHVRLRKEVATSDTNRLRELINGWYHMGAVDAAFGDGFHSLDYLPYLPDGEIAVRIDFGLSNRQAAVAALIDLLQDEFGNSVEISMGSTG